jgi:hypothetical protein
MSKKNDLSAADRSRLTPTQAIRCLKAIYLHNLEVGARNGRPDEYIIPMLWGSPGIGKTTIVGQAVEEIEEEALKLYPKMFQYKNGAETLKHESYDLVTEKIADKSPEEITGYPCPDEDTGTFKRLSPKKWTRKVPFVGFLDEIAQANTDQQNVARAIINERMVGDVSLPPGSTVVCASNPMEDRAGTHSMPTHVRDVLMHLYIVVNHKEWTSWGIQKGMHEMVTSFIYMLGDQWLHNLDPNPSLMAQPSPRSWTRVEKIFRWSIEDELKWPMIAAVVGAGATAAFRAHVELGHLVPNIDDLIKYPKKGPTGEADFKKHGSAIMYILCCALATKMTKDNADNIILWMKRVSSKSYCSFLLGMALERDGKELRKIEAVRDWLINHESDLLLGH